MKSQLIQLFPLIFFTFHCIFFFCICTVLKQRLSYAFVMDFAQSKARPGFLWCTTLGAQNGCTWQQRFQWQCQAEDRACEKYALVAWTVPVPVCVNCKQCSIVVFFTATMLEVWHRISFWLVSGYIRHETVNSNLKLNNPACIEE